jgi:hypothetical protein
VLSPHVLLLLQWHYDGNRQLRATTNEKMCLDIYYANTSNWAPLVLSECHQGTNQQWAVP